MPNPKLTTPTLPVAGYVNESATTVSEGMGVVAGSVEGGCTLGAANATAIGVVALSTEAEQGQVASVHIGHGGTCYLRSGAAFAAYAQLTLAANGRWVTCTSGQKIQAIALGAAAAADELIAAIRCDGLSVTA